MISRFLESRVYRAVILIVALLVAGSMGYHLLTGSSLLDSLYMTVITITTVGYGEVVPMGEAAKWFTVLLILASVAIGGYSLSIITETLVARGSSQRRKLMRQQKQIDELRDHVIVVGYGRNGRQVVQTLLSYDRDVLVIDNDSEVLPDDFEEFHYLEGDATLDETIEKAGVQHATALISALDEDAENLFVVLTARQLNDKIKIVARASQASTENKLKFAGADHVVMPNRIAGDYMSSMIVNRGLVDFMDNITDRGSEGVNLEEVPFDHIFNDREKCSIKEVQLRSNTGCTIIGYRHPDGHYEINPGPDSQVQNGGHLVVIGNKEQIAGLREFYKL